MRTETCSSEHQREVVIVLNGQAFSINSGLDGIDVKARRGPMTWLRCYCIGAAARAEAKATPPPVGGLAAAVLPVAAMGSAAAGDDAELPELGRQFDKERAMFHALRNAV
jgi:hypothetical protein